jgi:hypothetical protein
MIGPSRSEVGQAFQPDSDPAGPGPSTDGVRLESLTYIPARPPPGRPATAGRKQGILSNQRFLVVTQGS